MSHKVHHYTTELFSLLASGTVKVHVHKVYPFTAEGAIQAHEDMESGQTAGKLLIKVE